MTLAELLSGMAREGGSGATTTPSPPPEDARIRVEGSRDPSTIRICDLTDDSRTVLPGSLFIARVGTKVNGRDFIPDALAAGAVAILTDETGAPVDLRGHRVPVLYATSAAVASAFLAERFYAGADGASPSASLDLIGVTGTNGKTTTAHLVHQLLNGSGVRCGLIGTVQIDDGREVAEATLTTPPAMELSRTLATMVEAGCRAAVMEASSHALEQGRVAALRYDIAIFTNLTGDHLDYHGTMEAYAAAKARLLAMLPPQGWAIVNEEDPWCGRMLRDCGARVIRCRVADEGSPPPPAELSPMNGAGGEAAARVLGVSLSGTRVELAGPWGRAEVEIGLVGRHNVMNVLQAVCAAWCVGVAPRTLLDRVGECVAPAGRLEPVTRAGGGASDPFAVLVDYAHTDDALEKVLMTLRGVVGGKKEGGRILCVFGCGGDRDRTKRARMGEVASRLADLVFVTSDNPRTEQPSAIIDEILAGVPGARRDRVTVDADRRQAIARAVSAARAGDVVLIAGKGHETYQILPDGKGGTITQHFDDREEAREALAAARGEAQGKVVGAKAGRARSGAPA